MFTVQIFDLLSKCKEAVTLFVTAPPPRHVFMICICILIPRFLYSDEVQIGPETVMTTLYTAKKYAVPALEAHCVDFLTKHLRADNAFMLLTQVGKLKLSFNFLERPVFGGK